MTIRFASYLEVSISQHLLSVHCVLDTGDVEMNLTQPCLQRTHSLVLTGKSRMVRVQRDQRLRLPGTHLPLKKRLANE